MLDCRTERGQVFVERQFAIAERCAGMWRSEFAITPDNEDSPIDAIFSREHVMGLVSEIKARDLTLDQLHAFGSYLVTYAKLVKGREIGMALRVPFSLIVGLYPERHIVWWPICDADGTWRTIADVRRTTTQATCNGGTALRANAYLPLEGMTVIQPTVVEFPQAPMTADEINWGGNR